MVEPNLPPGVGRVGLRRGALALEIAQAHQTRVLAVVLETVGSIPRARLAVVVVLFSFPHDVRAAATERSWALR